jgi:hypothetical protein
MTLWSTRARIFPGGKGGRWVRLTTLVHSSANCLEIWHPHSSGDLSTFPDLSCHTCTILNLRGTQQTNVLITCIVLYFISLHLLSFSFLCFVYLNLLRFSTVWTSRRKLWMWDQPVWICVTLRKENDEHLCSKLYSNHPPQFLTAVWTFNSVYRCINIPQSLGRWHWGRNVGWVCLRIGY